MKRQITRVHEVKEGRKWKATMVDTDPNEVYRWLAHDLIAKKIHGATYIKSIRDVCNYDGTRSLTITYDNGCRNIYTIDF